MLIMLDKVLTTPPENPGFAKADPDPGVHPHVYGEFPPPSYQVPSFGHGLPSTQPLPLARRHSFPSMTTSTIQNPLQVERTAKWTRQATRAYDPVHGQRSDHPREGGRGRVCGTPNYKPREVQALLDLVEVELPIASKGWKVVGCQFRDWATAAEYPARSDRSLELKFKQVCVACANDMQHGYSQHPCSLSRRRSQLEMWTAHLRPSMPTRLTTCSNQKL